MKPNKGLLVFSPHPEELLSQQSGCSLVGVRYVSTPPIGHVTMDKDSHSVGSWTNGGWMRMQSHEGREEEREMSLKL